MLISTKLMFLERSRRAASIREGSFQKYANKCFGSGPNTLSKMREKIVWICPQLPLPNFEKKNPNRFFPEYLCQILRKKIQNVFSRDRSKTFLDIQKRDFGQKRLGKKMIKILAKVAGRSYLCQILINILCFDGCL